MMKKASVLYIFIAISLVLEAQQQVKIMHYNVLNFGVFSNYCTIANNDPEEKVDWAKTIIDYYLPDILVVNEMAPSAYYQNLLLDESLNTSGRNYYERAMGTNQAGSEIVNMIYFDGQKFGLAGQDVIDFWLRDINVYKLFFRTPDLAQKNDTIFLNLISAHFKAGSTGSDKTTRAQMSAAIMNYIDAHNISSACLLCGDLNLQNNLEPAWEDLTNNSSTAIDFTDPTGMEGIWHNNADFAMIHTQSTQTTSNGCKAAGGMDDRFDFILVNDTLMNEESPVKYVDASYEIPGQDGQRFNGSLINPPNFSAPEEVIDAMFNLSDHLPVSIVLEFEPDFGLPESWDFETTGVSHALYLPFEVQPAVNSNPLAEGSFIGMFFLDEVGEKCAGYKLWNSGADIELSCYGDDSSGPLKNGFYENEPIIFKVFDVQQQTEFYADADFNQTFPDADGRFHSNGVSVLTALDAAYLQYHTIQIDPGWGSVSSFVVPKWKNIQQVFGANMSGILYMTDGNDIYYPAGNISDLKFWDDKQSFLVKSSGSFTIDVEGLLVDDFNYELSEGWNMISVPVPCLVSPDDLMVIPATNLVAIKQIAGTGVYWPGKEISTLDLLIPGNVYFINVSDTCSLYFENCK